MDSGIPAPLSLTLLLFIFLSLILRLTLLNSTVTDKRLNIALTSVAASCALSDRTVQTVITNCSQSRLSPELLFELGELMTAPALGAFFLVTYTWINQSEPRYLASIVYAVVIVGAIIDLALRIDAWSKNAELIIHSSWDVIAYSSSPEAAAATIIVYNSLIWYSFSAMLLIACIRELRRKPNRRGIAIIVSMAMAAIGISTQTVAASVATLIVIAGRHNTFVDTVEFINQCSMAFYSITGVGIIAVPAFTRLLEQLRLDRFSRQRRRLLPLWRDLTTACPEIVYLAHGNLASSRSRYLLHRTVIEIRDSILILSCYAGHQDETAIRAADDKPLLQQAVRLASAWSAKITGSSPSNDFAAQQSAARDLLDETQELGKLADHWTDAKNIVAHVTHSAVAESCASTRSPTGHSAGVARL